MSKKGGIRVSERKKEQIARESSDVAILLKMQKEFCSRFMPVEQFTQNPESLAEDAKEDPRFYWCLDAVTCLIQESAELRNLMPWKHWKDYSEWRPLIPNIREEIVDQLHFVFNIAVTLGLTSEDIVGPDGSGLKDYFQEQKAVLREEKTDLSKLGDSPQVFEEKPTEELRVKETLKVLTRLELNLNELRQELPWNIKRQYSQWASRYDRYREIFKKILKIFVRECVIWGVTPDSLMEEYFAKHKINIQRQEEGYFWDGGPQRKKL